MRKFNLKCKKGFVVRKGFTKKNGTKVRATCIKKKISLRKKEKNHLKLKRVIIPISKNHELSKYGYKNIKELGVRKRHKSLSNSVNEYGAKKVLSKLGAIKTLHKNKAPKLSEKIHNNQLWLRKKFDKDFKSSYKNSTLFKKK